MFQLLNLAYVCISSSYTVWFILISWEAPPHVQFIGLAYQGKDIVFIFIIEYSSLRDFGPRKK